MDPDVRNLLTEEYRQLCADWRARDQYMQTKLSGSSFAFAVLAWVAKDVLTSCRHEMLWLGMGAALLAALYALLMYLSVAKDALYRRGTERAMNLVFDRLQGGSPVLVGKVGEVIESAEFDEPEKKTMRQLLLKDTPCSMWLPKRLHTTRLIRLFYLLVAAGFAYLAYHFAMLATT